METFEDLLSGYRDEVKLCDVQFSLPQYTSEMPAVVREQLELRLAEEWYRVVRDPHPVEYMILRIRLEQSGDGG